MKYSYKLLVVAILFPLFSIAQSNYKPGYVVTLNGDTLRGYINYKEWGDNPNKISFKAALADKNSSIFDTEKISYFDITGLAAYQRNTCSISMDQTDVNHLTSGRDSSFKMATVFLNVLQQGKNVTLFSYTDGIKTRFYIADHSTSPQELVYRTYFSNVYDNLNNNRTVTENIYKTQLLVIAQKYNVLSEDINLQIQRSEYTRSDLLHIISNMNGVTKTEFAKKYNEKFKANFYAGGGLNIATTTAGGDYQLSGGKDYTSYAPIVFAGINLPLSQNTGHLILRLDLSLTQNQYRSDYLNKIYPYVNINYAYDQLVVALTPEIIYNFYNAEKFKLYGGLGAEFVSFNYSNKVFKSTDGTQVTVNNPFLFNTTSSAIVLKAGILIAGRAEIFTNYLTSVSASASHFFILNVGAVQLGLNYHFGFISK